MAQFSPLLRTISIPQRLLLAAAFAYGGIFALILAYGRPGLGLGGALYVPVILAAAATNAPTGAVAGIGALFLYTLGMGNGSVGWSDVVATSTLTRLIGYVAAGVIVGYLAQRGRRMLAESLFVLEDLIELAHGRIEDADRLAREHVRESSG